jgi:hypothetical protein
MITNDQIVFSRPLPSGEHAILYQTHEGFVGGIGIIRPYETQPSPTHPDCIILQVRFEIFHPTNLVSIEEFVLRVQNYVREGRGPIAGEVLIEDQING